MEKQVKQSDLPPLVITNNILNTTVEYTADESGWLPVYTFTVRANEGATIKTTPQPTITYEDASWGEKTADLSVSDDGKTATATNLEISPWDNPNITINGESEGGTPTADVVNNIAGTTETHTIQGDSSIDITVTGDAVTSWFFDAKASYHSTDGTEKTVLLEISGDRPTYAKCNLTDADLSQQITLSGTYENRYEIENQTENCTVEGLKQYYKDGEAVGITLTANTGFVFEETEDKPYILFESSFNTIKIESDLYENGKKAGFSWQMNEGVSNPKNGKYYLFGKAVERQTPPVGSGYGAINVYVVTNENLDALAKQRFIQQTGESADAATAIDIGDYINRIKRIYTDIPISGNSTLMLGNYATGITVQTPAMDVITLDFGKVLLPAPNKDITDYESDYKLFLPFKGFVSISEDYAGQEISLQYVISIITGEGVAKLSCNGSVFQMEQITPSLDVIYRTMSQDVRTIGADNWNDFVLYGTEPFIYATYYLSRSSIRNNDVQRTEIGQISGFAIVDDVTPITTEKMLCEEQEQIYRLLGDGVYIE